MSRPEHPHLPRPGGMGQDDLSAYLESASALLGLPIAAAHRAAVEAAFAMLQAQARLVTEFSLPEETEAAPRYTP